MSTLNTAEFEQLVSTFKQLLNTKLKPNADILERFAQLNEIINLPSGELLRTLKKFEDDNQAAVDALIASLAQTNLLGQTIISTSVITTAGQLAISNATLAEKLSISRVVVGDGNDVIVTPDPDQISLVNEIYGGLASNPIIDPNNPTNLYFDLLLPISLVGTIREVGIISDENVLISVGSVVPVTKQGNESLLVRLVLPLQNVSQVDLFEFQNPLLSHGALNGREQADSHPISAITGLEDSLARQLEKALGVNARVYPRLTNQNLKVGDVIPAPEDTADGLPITHIVHSGNVYEMSPVASGVVTAIGGSQATIGGNDIRLLKYTNGNGVVDTEGFICRTVTPELYGAVGDGVTPCADAFLAMLEESKKGLLVIDFKRNAKYVIEKKVTVTESYGCIINGNGAEIVIGAPNSNKDTSISSIDIRGFGYSSNNHTLFCASNLTIDAINAFYNPWQYYADGKPWNNIVGFDLTHIHFVYGLNIKLKKIIGYGIRAFGFKKVILDNFDFDEVGGHNGQWGNDSYGDAIYLGWRKGETHVSIRNINAKGVTQPAGTGIVGGGYYSPRSRIFLTIEHLGSGVNADPDTTTTIHLENVNARDYQRFVHSEANKGDVIINGTNLDAMADIMFLSSESGGKGRLSVGGNSKFKLYDRDYNGTGGMNWGFLAVFTGCDIDLVDAKLDVGALSHKGGEFYSEYHRCSVRNIKSLLGNGKGDYRVFDSTLEFLESYNIYYNYYSKALFVRTIIKNIDGTKIKTIPTGVASSTEEMIDCTFVNMLPKTQQLVKKPSEIKLTSTLNGYDFNNLVNGGYLANIYVDNEWLLGPKTILGLSSITVPKPHKTGSIQTGSPVSFLPFDEGYLYALIGDTIYVVIRSGDAEINPFSPIKKTGYGLGGWIHKYTWNGSTYVFGKTYKVGGQDGAGMNLGFDTSAKTLNRDVSFSTYSNYYGTFVLSRLDIESILPFTVD